MSKVKTTHIYALSFVIIILLCCLQIRSMNYIYIINDEFGYWAHAVSAVGYDWKELIAETPYYSWGYSLWLIPLIVLLPTPELWYKAAVLLNVFFLLLSYCFCYKSGRKLFPEIGDKLMAIISLIVIIYPSNIIYAQVTWPETLSYLLVWINIYLIIKLDDYFSMKYFIFSLIVSLYGYAVHNRNIGVLFVNIFILALLLYKNKKKIRYYLLLPVIFIAGYRFIDFIKIHQINTLWGNSKASALNKVGLDTATITSYVSRIFNEIKLLLISMTGKHLYLIIGFGLLFPIVIIRFMKELSLSIKKKQFFNAYTCSRLWIFLTSVSMFCICALQMNRWINRKDLIVYSRYMENALGPLLLLTIAYSILSTAEMRSALAISVISILISIFPVYYYMHNARGYFNFICSPIIGVFYNIKREPLFTFILIGCFLALIICVLSVSCYTRNSRLSIILILLCFGLSYSSMGYLLSAQSVVDRKSYDDLRVPLRAKISGDLEELEIYYIKNQEVDYYSMYPKFLQYMIPDRTIHVILPEEVSDYLDQRVILMANPNDIENIQLISDNNAEAVDHSSLLAVFVTN